MLQMNFFSTSALNFDPNGEVTILVAEEDSLQAGAVISTSSAAGFCGEMSSSPLDNSLNEGSDSWDSR